MVTLEERENIKVTLNKPHNTDRCIDNFLNEIGKWGVGSVSVTKIKGETTIDFHTPMPGKQPIRSSIVVNDCKVVKGTIRMGVLEDLWEHRTDINDEMERLRETISQSTDMTGVQMSVNFGDPRRDPRPHVLISWEPSIDIGMKKVRRGTDRMDISKLAGLMQRWKRAIMQEFRGEWKNG